MKPKPRYKTSTRCSFPKCRYIISFHQKPPISRFLFRMFYVFVVKLWLNQRYKNSIPKRTKLMVDVNSQNVFNKHSRWFATKNINFPGGSRSIIDIKFVEQISNFISLLDTDNFTIFRKRFIIYSLLNRILISTRYRISGI